MKVTSDKVENSQAYLTIEMEPAEVEDSLAKSYSRLVKRMNIPGFRKGKAPRVVFERHFGRESLMDEALRGLIPEAYEKAIAEKNIEAFAQPSIEVVTTEPVVLKAVVPLKPTVKLGDYHKLRLSPEPVTLKEEMVSEAIEGLRHQHATWELVERPVALNDLITLDIESSIEGQAYINHKGTQYQVVANLPLPAPGFGEALIGMKRDEEKEFTLKFPSDYHRPELAEKEAKFKVKVLEVKQEKLPEANDDFAKMVDPGLKSFGELKEKLTENLKRQLEERARLAFENRVMEEVVKVSSAEFPPVLVEMEIDNIISDELREWQLNLEDYLKNTKKTEEELRDEARPLATKRVSQSLVLVKLAEEEKLSVSKEEVDAEIERLVKAAEEKRREELKKALSTERGREEIGNILLSRKTLAKLVEIVKEEKK